MLVQFRPPLERRSHTDTDVTKPAANGSAFPCFGLVVFTLGEVAPNRSRLLVVTVGLLLAVAAIIQAIGGDSSPDPVDPETVSSSSSHGTSTADSDIASTSVPPTNASSTTITPTIASSPQTSIDYPPTSTASIGEGAVRISGYGPKVITAGDEWSSYRTVIYRSKGSGSELLIDLLDDEQVTVLSFGYSDANSPIEGLRFLTEVAEDVADIVVTATAGWEIDLLPDAFLWNQQMDAGNAPKAEDLMLFSSEGLTFVGSQLTPSAQGIGDLRIYNVCHAPCDEGTTTWVFELDPACSNTPGVFIKEVGTDFFQRTVRPVKSESGKDTLEVSLESYDWLEMLTPCQWSATPTSG